MDKIVSLYSGCGGMDLGFIQAGFNVIWGIDNDKSAYETYKFNLSGDFQYKNIHNVDINEIPDMDILIAGPPCQGFSTVGKMNPNDERNFLLELIIEIVEIKKPKIILIENVRGLTAFKSGNTLLKFINDLENQNYKVEHEVINASDFGIPQNRQRIIIFANKIGIDNFFDDFINNYAFIKKKSLFNAIGDIEDIGTLPNHYFSNKWPEHYKFIMKKILEGQKLCNTRLGKSSVHTWEIPEVYGETTKREKNILFEIAKNRRLKKYRKKESWQDASPLTFDEIKDIMQGKLEKKEFNILIKKGFIVEKFKNLYDIKNTFNGKFRRLLYNKPSEAILTNYSSPRNYIHPKKNRPFTVRECARIQGFPDNFFFLGSLISQYRMVGNAVPPPLALLLAFQINDILIEKGFKKAYKKKYLDDFVPNTLKQVHFILKKKYGNPRLGNLNNPIDELLFIIISQRTFEKSYLDVFKKLKAKYKDHESLRGAKVSDIAEILKPAGLSKQKAIAIHNILEKIFKDFGETSLNKLTDFDDTSKLTYLMTLPRVGIKTAYCIMMYSFDSKVLPIDANIRRVANRIGFLDSQKNAGKEHEIIHTLIPKEWRYDFHVNTLIHGRKVCIPEHPICNLCSLNYLCDYFKQISDKIEAN